MEKKTETKLQRIFRLSEKTREDGGALRDAHDAEAAFMIPPPYFNIEHAQELPASWRGLSFSFWF